MDEMRAQTHGAKLIVCECLCYVSRMSTNYGQQTGQKFYLIYHLNWLRISYCLTDSDIFCSPIAPWAKRAQVARVF